MKIYSIYDESAEEHSPPFVSPNDRTAFRSFVEMTKNHPYNEDLKLFLIGAWDKQTSKIQPLPTIEEIKPERYEKYLNQQNGLTEIERRTT